MGRSFTKLACWLLIVAVFFSCVSAQINVVDERTALENQILGSYQELDHNLQLMSSVRAIDSSGNTSKTPQFSKLRELAIQARQTQQFNRDDIDELKQLGCLGEANDSLLAARPCPSEFGSKMEQHIQRVMHLENEARKTILNFVVFSSPDLTEKDLPELVNTYSRMQRQQSKPGEWVQEPSGEWKKIP